jgi:NAD-dependent aldehyde dehydrogenases
VGQIVPWNYPLWAAAWNLGPALVAGNTCVLEPASDTPLSTSRAVQLSEGILPDGVLNVVTSPGSEIGQALAEHDDVLNCRLLAARLLGAKSCGQQRIGSLQ